MAYLTARELSEKFKVSERQITHLARNGHLPGFKIGKLWRFRAEDIEAWERWQKGIDEIEKLADEIVSETK